MDEQQIFQEVIENFDQQARFSCLKLVKCVVVVALKKEQ